MSSNKKILIVIAESSPVVSAGFHHCLQRLPGVQAHIMEVKTPADLMACVKSNSPDIILANPGFGGYFNPDSIRAELAGTDVKIIAIELGKLNAQTSALYDNVISVIDDTDTIANKIRSISSDGKTSVSEKESLSQREKEIISHVVKGMTNQEIADKLFLSIHTVITHRRNIARKLEIHSATGLTIYAIVNKIVDLSEIKL